MPERPLGPGRHSPEPLPEGDGPLSRGESREGRGRRFRRWLREMSGRRRRRADIPRRLRMNDENVTPRPDGTRPRRGMRLFDGIRRPRLRNRNAPPRAEIRTSIPSVFPSDEWQWHSNEKTRKEDEQREKRTTTLRTERDGLFQVLRGSPALSVYVISPVSAGSLRFTQGEISITLQFDISTTGRFQIWNTFIGSRVVQSFDNRDATPENIQQVLARHFESIRKEAAAKDLAARIKIIEAEAHAGRWEPTSGRTELYPSVRPDGTLVLWRGPLQRSFTYDTVDTEQLQQRVQKDIANFTASISAELPKALEAVIAEARLPSGMTAVISDSGNGVVVAYRGWRARISARNQREWILQELRELAERMPKEAVSAEKQLAQLYARVVLPPGTTLTVAGASVTLHRGDRTQTFNYSELFGVWERGLPIGPDEEYRIRIPEETIMKQFARDVADFAKVGSEEEQLEKQRAKRMEEQRVRAEEFVKQLRPLIQSDVPISVTPADEFKARITVGPSGGQPAIIFEHSLDSIAGPGRVIWDTERRMVIVRREPFASSIREFIQINRPEWIVYDVNSDVQRQSKEVFDRLRSLFPPRVQLRQRSSADNQITISVSTAMDAPVNILIRADGIFLPGSPTPIGTGEGVAAYFRSNRAPWVNPLGNPSLTYQEQERLWEGEVAAKEKARAEEIEKDREESERRNKDHELREEGIQKELVELERDLPGQVRRLLPRATVAIQRRGNALVLAVTEAGYDIRLSMGALPGAEHVMATMIRRETRTGEFGGNWATSEIQPTAENVVTILRERVAPDILNIPERLQPGGEYVLPYRYNSGAHENPPLYMPILLNGRAVPTEWTADRVGQYVGEQGLRGSLSDSGITIRRGYDRHFNDAVIISIVPDARVGQNVTIDLGYGGLGTRIERRIEAGSAAPPPVIDAFNRLPAAVRRNIVLRHSYERDNHLVLVDSDPLFTPDEEALKIMESILQAADAIPWRGDALGRREIRDVKRFTDAVEKHMKTLRRAARPEV